MCISLSVVSVHFVTREGLKNSSVSISELSQVSVPRIISGDVVSMSTSIFFPFFLILWKLMFKIRRFFFSVSDLGGIGFGEEVAVGLPKDMFELAKLSQFWVSCDSLIGDESCSSSSALEYMLPRLVSSATGMS